MNTGTQVPTVWNQLAEAMYLKDSLTARLPFPNMPRPRLRGFRAPRPAGNCASDP
jgi:hypothetical protein